MMELDIERLHEVIEGKKRGRQCGRTTALSLQIAGAAYINFLNGDTNQKYLVVVKNRTMADILARYILEAVDVLGIQEDNPAFEIRRDNARDHTLSVHPSNGRIYISTVENVDSAIIGNRLTNYYIDDYANPSDKNIHLIESATIKQ